MRICNKYTKFDFGKYKGYEVGLVFLTNPGYIHWCLFEIDGFYISDLDELVKNGIRPGSDAYNYEAAIGAIGIEANEDIDVFKTYDEFIEGCSIRVRYKFSDIIIKKNNEKTYK